MSISGYFKGIYSGHAKGWIKTEKEHLLPVVVEVVQEDGAVVAEGSTVLQNKNSKEWIWTFSIPLPISLYKDKKKKIGTRIKNSSQMLPGGTRQLLPETRLTYHIDGFVEYATISGWVKDYAAPEAIYTIELYECNKKIASVRNDALINEQEKTGRFVFNLPENFLDAKIHIYSFYCKEIHFFLDTISFLNPCGEPQDYDLLYPFLDDSPWEGSKSTRRIREEILKNVYKRDNISEKNEKIFLQQLSVKDNISSEKHYENSCTNKPSSKKKKVRLFKSYWLTALPTDNKIKNYYEHAALLVSKNDPKTIPWLRKALEHFPGDPILHKHLDTAYSRQKSSSVKMIAFYLPQFHPIPENDRWWGKGFTEWSNVAAAKPLFKGHLQPRRPTALGYYDLRLPETANAQFALAHSYGIDAFCYYYYWFNGKKLLEGPIQDLKNGKTGPFPFCICWANENWTRSWDGASDTVLIKQEHNLKSDIEFIKEITPYLRHPYYVRRENKPVLLVYRADKLKEPARTVQVWRNWCRKHDIGELYLCAVQSFHFDDPRELGFDAVVEFPPHSLQKIHPELDFKPEIAGEAVDGDTFKGLIFNYSKWADTFMQRPRERYRVHYGCFLAWDNTARRGNAAHIFHHFSTEKYGQWLTQNLAKASNEDSENFVFINAWNEWAEGSVLEPEAHFDYALLEETRRSKILAPFMKYNTFWMRGKPSLPVPPLKKGESLILIGHDACQHGAQINLLHMARCLRWDFHCNLCIILLKGGPLTDAYQNLAETVIIDPVSSESLNELNCLLETKKNLGYKKAILNTVVTGGMIEHLNRYGYRTVSLIHELPSLIESKHLESCCWIMAAKSDGLVFASHYVAEAFCNRYWPDPRKVLISPQGISLTSRFQQRNELRERLRKKCGWSPATKIVVGCGYGDVRKGIELFVQLCGILGKLEKLRNVAFMWIGAIDASLEPYIRKDIRDLNLEKYFYLTGFVQEPDQYYIAADVYVLTSREDPFPSTVMEAFNAGLPVIAFEKGGGSVDIVNDTTGAVVPYLDLNAMANSVEKLLSNEKRLHTLSQYVRELSEAHFSYPPYMDKLLAILNQVPAKAVAEGFLQPTGWYEKRNRPSISVIIPNYNYGRYLQLRLHTILEQTLLPEEIIILDDASTDDSVEIIENIIQNSNIPITFLKGTKNSGNPFLQWAKGIRQAKGELIWIAEADDYCEPQFLEKVTEALVSADAVMAWSDSVMVDQCGRSQGTEYKDSYIKTLSTCWKLDFTMQGKELCRRQLCIANVIPNASAVLFRRAAVDETVLDQIPYYHFSGDWWFWIHLAEKGIITYLAKTLNYHRRHNQSVMGHIVKDSIKLLQETLTLYKELTLYSPHLLTSDTRIAILRHLETLYRTFPSQLAISLRLKENPHFKVDYQRLVEVLQPCKAITSSGYAQKTLLVLSLETRTQTNDVFSFTEKVYQRYLVEHILVLNKDMSFQLLENLIELNHYLKNKGNEETIPGIDCFETEWPSMEAHSTFDNIIKRYSRVLSNGLQAHIAIFQAPKNTETEWNIIADREFDFLLGRLFCGSYAAQNLLEAAIKACNALYYLHENMPHPLGVMALRYNKPLERLLVHKGDYRAKKNVISADPKIRYIWGSDMSSEALCKLVESTEREREKTGIDIRLRILLNYDDLQMRYVIPPKKFLEIIYAYELAPDIVLQKINSFPIENI